MLARIFKGKSRLNQPDPGARRQAVLALSTARAEALQAQLLAMAGSDKDAGVRQACIAKLTSIDALAGLLAGPDSADPAAQRIVELIGSDPATPMLQHEAARHPLVFKLRLLEMAPEQAGPELADIDDTQLLVDLAIRSRGELREAVVERLRTAAALTELEHQTRGRDKSLNRFAREHLERIKATRRDAQETHARLVRLAEATERHQRVDADRGAANRHAALLREFDQASARFATLARELRDVGEEPPSVDHAHRQVAAARERPPAPAPAEPMEDPFPALVNAFEDLHQSMREGSDFATVTVRRQELTEQWLTAADRTQPSPAEHQVFETVSHAYRELADSVGRLSASHWSDPAPLPEALPTDPQHLRELWRQAAQNRRALRDGQRKVDSIAWPTWAKPTPEYADVLLGINRIEQDLQRAAEHERMLHSRLAELIDALTAEIDGGALKSAFSTLNQARQLSKSLPERSVADLVKNLNQEAARLAELRDWQTFATGPKREALCEAMQALVEHPFDPPDQAERIKHLRGDWNELGPVSTSADRKLADQFNALAEQAFEPCRAYFEKQANVRKTNLAERRKICDQLETYLDTTDWQRADKKAAEQIMRAARDEWRRFHPVDRNPGRPLEERFEKLQGRLYDLIKAEWDANLKLKQAIVDEARALLAGDADVTERVNQAKGLQRRWREVGITPRRPDQALWREFRAACDDIFAARDEAKNKSDRATEHAMETATALLDEWQQVVAAATPADASEQVLRDFRSRFANLPVLPDRTHRDLQNRFDTLLRTYRVALQSQARDAERAQLEQLRVWDTEVATAEATCHSTGATELAIPDPLFEPRQQTLDDELPIEALRTLTIRAELLAGVESPPSDAELRLQLQVDRLNAGMGQQHSAPDPLDLAREWCQRGPKHAGCETLRDRFFAALARAMED